MHAQRQKQDKGHDLQRHQLEISLICIFGLVLGLQCARQSPYGCSWLTAGSFIVHASSLILEFSGDNLVSPYKLRRCESHGFSQGNLAVPSVLSALATRMPRGASYHWQLGVYAAALAIVLTVYVQSKAAKALPEISAKERKCRNGTEHGLRPDGSTQAEAVDNHSSSRMQWLSTVQNSRSAAATVVLAALFINSSLLVPQTSQRVKQFLVETLPQHDEPGTSLLAVALGAVMTPALYCLIMQLLPSCFSIGEGIMMAQGAAALLVLAVRFIPQANVFVPPAFLFSSRQPQHAAVSGFAVHSLYAEWTATAQLAADQALPAAIVLISAAVLLVCLFVHWVIMLAKKRNETTVNSCSNLVTAFRWLAISVLCAIICGIMVWLSCAAAWTLLVFLPAKPGRLLVLLYWVGLLIAALPALRIWASNSRVPQIIVRKAYHLLAGALFVPVFFWDLQMLCLSLAISFVALVLLELVRKLKIRLLGQAVQRFMQGFVDERDSGCIYITHFTLLLGIAIPMWLSLGLPVTHQPGQHDQQQSSSRLLQGPDTFSSWQKCAATSFSSTAADAGLKLQGTCGNVVCGSSDALMMVMVGLSGMIIIGVGDTAASAVGKLLGRIPVYAGSRKTVEGTIAGIVSSLCAWYCLLWCVGLQGMGWQWWCKLTAVTVGAGLLEACTSQLDNILLPLWYMPHLLLLQP